MWYMYQEINDNVHLKCTYSEQTILCESQFSGIALSQNAHLVEAATCKSLP